MISVIIPTYKRPEFLERALKSVQAQTVQSWEAIVVDDGDGQGIELAFSLRDARIRAYPNWGSHQTDARNTALLRAECDYIALLDDDDWWEDPHNLDPAYARVRVRQALAVLEQALGPGLTTALARTAQLARQDADALDALAVTCATDHVPALAALPAALRARVLKALAEAACGVAVTSVHVLALRALVEDWRGQGAVALPGGVRLARRGDRLVPTPGG